LRPMGRRLAVEYVYENTGFNNRRFAMPKYLIPPLSAALRDTAARIPLLV